MKTILTTFLLIASANFSFAQEAEYPVPPSDEHARLKATVGVWDAEIEITSPDGNASSTGVETVKMLGELWVVSDFKYEFMGAPVHGHGTTGYDPAKGKYVGTWIESGSPYISTMEGEYDEKNKAIVYKMMSKDEQGNDAEFKAIDTQIDAKHKTFEMHVKVAENQYVPILKIKYTKRDE